MTKKATPPAELENPTNRERNMASRIHFTQLLLRHESTSNREEQSMILERLSAARKSTLIQCVNCDDDKEKAYLDSQYKEISRILYTITDNRKYIQGIKGLT